MGVNVEEYDGILVKPNKKRRGCLYPLSVDLRVFVFVQLSLSVRGALYMCMIKPLTRFTMRVLLKQQTGSILAMRYNRCEETRRQELG